jgi:hypothetical protein
MQEQPPSPLTTRRPMSAHARSRQVSEALKEAYRIYRGDQYSRLAAKRYLR